MTLRNVVFALVFVAGLGLVWYGVVIVSPPPQYYMDVDETVNRNEIPADGTVIEYETLAPSTQEAFEQAVTTREQVVLGDAPKEFTTGYVHYRGTYYSATLIVGDFDQTRQLLSVGGGMTLLIVATVGWGLSRFKPKREDGTPSKPA